ncbi:MAG: DUF3467 domain-containing protein [Deltaproteobacteria bacterium]|nr:DUF3467 domain-containing protein [Deltaproteobacteria bacterium]
MNHKREIPQDTRKLEGRYANYFKVGHNAFELVIDAGQLYNDAETAQAHTRIISSPIYAKALLETLRESIKRYEQTFGIIPSEDDKTAGDTIELSNKIKIGTSFALTQNKTNGYKSVLGNQRRR